MLNNVTNIFNKIDYVQVDKVCDHIPFVSTITNVTNLAHKILHNCTLSNEEAVQCCNYCAHVEQKSVLDCVVRAIPGIGNVWAGAVTLTEETDPNRILDNLRKSDPWSLQYVSAKLLDSADFMLDVLRESKYPSLAIKYASGRLKENRDFMLAAAKIDCSTVEHADAKLLDSADFMLDFLRKTQYPSWSIKHASRRLRANSDFMLQAMRIDPRCFEHALRSLRTNQAFLSDAEKIDPKIRLKK